MPSTLDALTSTECPSVSKAEITTPGRGVRVDVIVPPIEQLAADCANGAIGFSAATTRPTAGMTNLTVPAA